MNYEQICNWLGISSEKWPPDHYTLLGLTPGEPDLERIEQQVHERLARVRPYQMIHPDQVTEAMNRLAQAFTVLTDPPAKRSYDATLLAKSAPESSPSEPAPIPEQVVPAMVVEGGDPLAWLFGPWSPASQPEATPPAPSQVQDWTAAPPPPVRQPVTPPSSAIPEARVNGPVAKPVAPVEPTVVPPPPKAPPAPLPPPPPPVDPVVQAAQLSAPARRGLGTRRAVYNRIALTRKLLRTWDLAGKYLNRPTRKLTKQTEAAELTALLEEIKNLLKDFPSILGGAGQPGYYVLTLAKQNQIIPTFRGFLPSQREDLAKHWRDGREVIISHQEFLRKEVRALHKIGIGAQTIRAVRAAITDQPATLILLVGLLALLIAVWLQFYH